MSRAGTGVVVGMTAAGAVVSSMVVVRIALARQAAYARRGIGKPLGEDALEADRVWRRKLDGEPLELLRNRAGNLRSFHEAGGTRVMSRL